MFPRRKKIEEGNGGYTPPTPFEDNDVKIIGDAPELTDFLPNLEGHFWHSAWDSPEAYARHIGSLDQKSAWQDAGWEKGNKDFYGTDTLDEALEMAFKGWPQGVEEVTKLQGLIAARNPLIKKPVSYGIVGTVPSVPRAVAGNPLNMKKPDLTRSQRKPVITLMSNMSANWTIDQQALTNRAAVVAAVIDRIEASGFSCEVIVTSISRGWERGFKGASSVIVKKSHQPIDIPRLAFCLGHAAFFRRLMFCDRGGDKWARDFGGGLGSSVEVIRNEDTRDKNVYMVPSANNGNYLFKDMDDASTKGLNYILEYLRIQGCPAFKGYPEFHKFTKGEIERLKIQDLLDPDYKKEEDEDDDDEW